MTMDGATRRTGGFMSTPAVDLALRYDFGLRLLGVCRVFLNVMTCANTTRTALVMAVVTIVAVFAGVARSGADASCAKG